MFGELPTAIDMCKNAEKGFAHVRWATQTYHDAAIKSEPSAGCFLKRHGTKLISWSGSTPRILLLN